MLQQQYLVVVLEGGWGSFCDDGAVACVAVAGAACAVGVVILVADVGVVAAVADVDAVAGVAAVGRRSQIDM